MASTQGQGEDQEEDGEGVEREEAKETPKDTKAKKRKAKEQIVEKLEKAMKKPDVCNTRSSTREATIQASEILYPKGKRTPDTTEPSELVKKTYKGLKKLVPQPNSDEEKIESDVMSQFMVSQNPSSNLDNLCDNIKSNVDLSSFTHIEFDK